MICPFPEAGVREILEPFEIEFLVFPLSSVNNGMFANAVCGLFVICCDLGY